MRHGAAEDRAPTGRDSDRSLTPAGRAIVGKVALTLRDAQPAPIERLIASPLVRAQQTAEIVRSILCPDLDIDTDEDLAPDASAYDLTVRLAASSRVVFLVGHQPNIEMVARALARPTLNPHTPPSVRLAAAARAHASGRPPLRLPVGFRTAAVVGFRLEGRPPPYVIAVSIDPSQLSDSSPPSAG